MGLDMFLYASRYYWSEEPRPVTDDGHPIVRAQSEAAYWRKANAIHQWFVDNVQDGKDECQETEVSREQLQKLLDLCKEVLTAPEQLGPELLPTQSGFFFGSTAYDEGYVDDLKATIEQLEKALSAFSDKWDFIYFSSW